MTPQDETQIEKVARSFRPGALFCANDIRVCSGAEGYSLSHLTHGPWNTVLRRFADPVGTNMYNERLWKVRE